MAISYEIRDGKLYVEGEVFTDDTSGWTQEDIEDSKIAKNAFNNLNLLINKVKLREEKLR